ncbi:uncharacterized protein LOC125457899 [Stegostoma tigrinum]|uniref:uncharacterized protein LOC125457899 n=1 Tax=Stegostoma tigrinum TaxID=3053191 RepID=UPI00202B92E8|nr:uncharacterized protein LOC125457899 [Stegostoma tigrinum]
MAMSFAQQIFLVFSVTLGESLILTQYPMTVEKKCNQSAQIYCELRNGNLTDDMRLVWYKYTYYRSKIGEINLRTSISTAIDHIHLQWDLGTYRASMLIRHLVKNDSGEYGCELVSFSGPKIITKANATHLIVTDKQWIGPPNRNITDRNEAEKFQNKEASIQIIASAVIAAFVIICLLIYILFRYRPKKQGPNANPPPADVSCQKAEDPISTVFCPDYAALKVPGQNTRQTLASSIASDDSYYATIVFAPQQQATGVQKTNVVN